MRLRLIATTDLHMHVLPWDYPTGRPFGGRGLATLARLVAAARDEVPNALLFDNGDFLQGSALGDHHARDAADGPRSNPMIAAMNLLGYDAATLGNHEFSHGLPRLRAALAEARFPVVASNLHPTAPQSLFTDGPALPRVVPHLVLQRDLVDEAGIKRPLRIGLLGFLPPQTGIWERGNLDGWHIDDILPAARQGVADLRGLGADLIVALSHSGIEPGPASPGLENASAQLAALDGIDAVIAGHAHLAFPSRSVPPAPEIDPLAGTLHGKPAVMAGAFGSHLGVIDLLLEQDAADQWSVIAHRTALRANSAGAEAADPAICGAVQADHQATLDWLARPVGRTDRRLGTHFALVAPSRALRLIAQAKARYVADRLQGTAFGHLPVLASTAPFRAGGAGRASQLQRRAARAGQLAACAGPLPPPQHHRRLAPDGGRDGRLAGTCGGVVPHDPDGATGPAALSAGFPVVQLRPDRRAGILDRPVATAPLRSEGRFVRSVRAADP